MAKEKGGRRIVVKARLKAPHTYETDKSSKPSIPDNLYLVVSRDSNPFGKSKTNCPVLMVLMIYLLQKKKVAEELL